MSGTDPQALIRSILRKRGISQEDEVLFFRPDFEAHTHDPFLLKDIDKAIARLTEAWQRKEKVVVFGDYDADGVPATALLHRSLTRLGLAVETIIPTREEGYGLQAVQVEKISALDSALLITVDNGTVSKAEIADLKERGIDTIVCDHHKPQPGHQADAAIALINPHQDDCAYPFKDLCGCSLAWKLMQAFYQAIGQDWQALKWDLDLVALSTMADMMTLQGENRVLVSYGMRVLRKTRNQGLKALMQSAGIDQKTVTAGSLGYYLAPRLNAPSRMHADLVNGKTASLQLLVTEDNDEAAHYAGYLEELNKQRQDLLQEHVDEALTMVSPDASCLVVWGEEWSTGVIGLVAGRLLEEVRLPSIALAQEHGVWKGSFRAGSRIDSLDLLRGVAEHLERFGGHSKAAGLSLAPTSSPALFAEAVQRWFDGQGIRREWLIGQSGREVDARIGLAEADGELAAALEGLAPYGIGFPSFWWESEVTVAACRVVGKQGIHVSLMLQDGEITRKAIWFRAALTDIPVGTRCRAVYVLEQETWRGTTSPVCHVKELEILEHSP